jgi:uncharacterized membrane protein YhaH (DUF805 family)
MSPCLDHRRACGCSAQAGESAALGYGQGMKKIIELLLCFLHPIAVVLIWIDLLTRREVGTGAKIAWAIFVIIPIVPFIYVLTGGDLW